MSNHHPVSQVVNESGLQATIGIDRDISNTGPLSGDDRFKALNSNLLFLGLWFRF